MPPAASGASVPKPAPAPNLPPTLRSLTRLRAQFGQRHLYPGSPLLAVAMLRPQDRAVLVELQGSEVNALNHTLAAYAKVHEGVAPQAQVERGDGYARLRAWLPPPERRGLTFIDPPYEQTGEDFQAVTQALAEGLRRFPTGVMAAWYPIKDERSTAPGSAPAGPNLPPRPWRANCGCTRATRAWRSTARASSSSTRRTRSSSTCRPGCHSSRRRCRRSRPRAAAPSCWQNQPHEQPSGRVRGLRPPGEPQPVPVHPRPVRARRPGRR